MKNIVRLSGEKVNLTVLRTDDEAKELYMKWMSNETTALYIEKNDVVIEVSQMPQWLHDPSVFRMGIVDAATDELVGYCHVDHRATQMAAWLSINIGAESARGKGFGKDAVKIMCRWCFDDLGVNSVHADILECNEPSKHTFASVGFTQTGIYRAHDFSDGEVRNWTHWDIVESEWRERYGYPEKRNE